ncbi:MAG TPA: DUF3365 domain-containing protein [Flavilitoribacter sp.]|nr:DUF3365 domain-containing protein [Flavilitoribacter sp.]HMQ88835.1 DUF3365 domain-containing protein [Flavilitoribacter sp.]
MKRFKIAFWISVVVLAAAGCKNQPESNSLTEAEKAAYLEKGKGIAAATFTVLSGNLTSALEKGGVSNAVQYCNLAAMPLTDSLSGANHAVIRRTSLKVRNPQNSPSEWERAALLAFEKQDQAGEELKPVVRLLDGQRVAFAAPIRVMPLCTKCHGKEGETMNAADAQVIRSLYPQDQATGYAEGDLRGMWSIVFTREQ